MPQISITTAMTSYFAKTEKRWTIRPFSFEVRHSRQEIPHLQFITLRKFREITPNRHFPNFIVNFDDISDKKFTIDVKKDTILGTKFEFSLVDRYFLKKEAIH